MSKILGTYMCTCHVFRSSVDVCCTRSCLWLFVQVFLCDGGFLIEGSYGMSNVIGEV